MVAALACILHLSQEFLVCCHCSRITQGILQSYRFVNILLDNNFDPIADSEVFAARTERFDRFYTLFRTKATTRDPFIKLLCSLLDIPVRFFCY